MVEFPSWDAIVIIISLISISGGLIATYFKGVLKTFRELAGLEIRLNEKHAQTGAQITSMEVRQNEKHSDTRALIAAAEVKVSLFWTYLEAHLPDMLKRPTHLIMDGLLEKFKQRTIAREETIQLKSMIEELMKEDMKARREMVLPDMLMLGLIDFRLAEFDKR